MANKRVERLRAELLGSPLSYADIGRESSLDKSYIRKFAAGQIEDLTVTRFEILENTMKRLKHLQSA